MFQKLLGIFMLGILHHPKRKCVCVSHFLTNVEHTHIYSPDDQQPDDIRPPPSQPPALRTHRMYGSPYANRTRVLVHEKPATRGTWAPHGVDDWYIGPSMLRYRCYRIWIPETLSVRVADTLAWFPAQVKMPALSSTSSPTEPHQNAPLLKSCLKPSKSPAATYIDLTRHRRQRKRAEKQAKKKAQAQLD
jgi:hypothetical protein